MHFKHALRTARGAARLRVALTYLWRHGRVPRFTDPRLFSELVQLRKLHDRDPRLPLMADKVAMKNWVGERLGREWVVPLLWSGTTLPRHRVADGPLVIKSRHGCNQTLLVRDPLRQWSACRRVSEPWSKHAYGLWLDEWLYRDIPRGLLIEPWIGTEAMLPLDYKIYVFGGQATHVQVHLDRGGKHRWVMHDTGWCPLTNGADAVARPSALPAMLAAAEELADGFDFARVDFYQPGDQPLFGEVTFYPGSGLDPFDPPKLDAELGALWLEAIARRHRDEAAEDTAAPKVAASVLS